MRAQVRVCVCVSVCVCVGVCSLVQLQEHLSVPYFSEILILRPHIRPITCFASPIHNMHSPATYSANNLIRLTPAQCSLDRGRTSNSSGNGDIGSSSSRSNSSRCSSSSSSSSVVATAACTTTAAAQSNAAEGAAAAAVAVTIGCG